MKEWKISGGPELQALLEAMPKKWGNRVLRNGGRAAAVVVQKEAKAKVRRRTGRLQKAIKVSTRIDGDLIIARVRVKGRGAFLGPFMEYGVAPHLISVSDEDTPTTKTRHGTRKVSIGTMNKMVKRGSLVINGNFVGPYVQHPGHPAYPFMRPALDTKGQEAINAMGEYIRSHLSWDELKAPKVQVIGDEE